MKMNDGFVVEWRRLLATYALELMLWLVPKQDKETILAILLLAKVMARQGPAMALMRAAKPTWEK